MRSSRPGQVMDRDDVKKNSSVMLEKVPHACAHTPARARAHARTHACQVNKKTKRKIKGGKKALK